jgi:hypothetical protein
MSTTSVALTSSLTTRHAAGALDRLRRHLPLVVAAVTLTLASAALILAHSSVPLAIPRAEAVRAVTHNPAFSRALVASRWNRVDVTPTDSHYEELGFYRGPRMVFQVTLIRTRTGLIFDGTDLRHESYAFGSDIANDTRVLAGLGVLFVLMTAVWPLWRLRNLDCLVAAGTALTVVLFNEWTLGRMVLFSYPALIYLALRCACQAFAPPAARLPVTPLYDHLTRRWTSVQRVRVLRVLAAALAVITALVGFTSLHILDVGYAVMEGGTDLVHGVLPYGHIADVLHGDTYPIGSYLLYAPFALAWPVHTAWDDADVTLVVAVVAALLTALAAWRMTRSGSTTTGLRTAIAVLAFPPLLVTVSTGTTDVVLAAMLAGALLLWRRPASSGAVLSAAAWFKASPILLVPLLLAPLRGRSAVRAVVGLLSITVLMLGALVAFGGVAAVSSMLKAMSFQFTRSSPHTLWAMVGSVPLQQVTEAATLALVAGAALRLRRDGALAGDRTRMAALAGAVLLGLQIAASYWNYMYLVWALPFLAIGLFTTPSGVAEGALATPSELTAGGQ